MKKLILFIVFALLLTSCEQSLSQKEKKAARQREKDKKEQVVKTTVVETPAPVVAEPEPIPYYEPATTYTQLATIPTYWYITFEEVGKDNDGDRYSVDWHRAVKLNTPYFDFMEARKQFEGECKGLVYFDFITQISKESYDSWYEFRRIYHGK